MPAAARAGDFHACPRTTPQLHVGGTIISGSMDVFIEFCFAARISDNCMCLGMAMIMTGSSSVFINHLSAARVGDTTNHDSRIVRGSATVNIG